MDEIELSPAAQAEQVALQKATERMRAEKHELEAQNRILQTLIDREERLATHLREVIAASRKERQSIEAEKNRLFSATGTR